MVERHLYVKLDGSTDGQRERRAKVLRATFGHLPGIQAARVGLPADIASQKAWDLSVVLEFPTLAALENALASDVFLRLERLYLTPNVVVIKAWSFELE